MNRYFIASIKHTSKDDEHITWWGPNGCGYTPVVGERIGEYDAIEAGRLNDGCDTLAVPVDVVKGLLSPEPHFRNYKGVAAKFYDQHGPVVDNTLANWRALVVASGAKLRIKPAHYRRKVRRSFGLPTTPPTKEPTA